jgi:hypothetical protein
MAVGVSKHGTKLNHYGDNRATLPNLRHFEVKYLVSDTIRWIGAGGKPLLRHFYSGAENTAPVIDNTFGNLHHGNRHTVLKIEDESRHIEYQGVKGIGVKGTRLRPGISDSSMPLGVYTKVLRAIGYMRYERAVGVCAMLS